MNAWSVAISGWKNCCAMPDQASRSFLTNQTLTFHRAHPPKKRLRKPAKARPHNQQILSPRQPNHSDRPKPSSPSDQHQRPRKLTASLDPPPVQELRHKPRSRRLPAAQKPPLLRPALLLSRKSARRYHRPPAKETTKPQRHRATPQLVRKTLSQPPVPDRNPHRQVRLNRQSWPVSAPSFLLGCSPSSSIS